MLLFEQWAGLRWEVVRTGEGTCPGKVAGRAIEQNQEDRVRRSGRVREARKGSCARFLGWEKNLVGGVLGGGQGQHLSIREGAVREPVLTCWIYLGGWGG